MATDNFKTYDIRIEQGSTFFLSISLENQEGYILNIKDCVGVMQIRDIKTDVSKMLLDVTPYLTFTYDNRIYIKVNSKNLFEYLVKPHIQKIPSMLYKLYVS